MIDVCIIILFLIITLIIGIYSGKNITTLKQYAIGNRNFSTATIAATIVATWISGGSFSITTAETYNKGLYFVIPGLGDVISFFIIAYVYAPRVSEFLGNLSVAEAMGNLYDSRVRCITAISGFFPAIGNVAMQFSLLATMLSYMFSISSIYATILSSIIVIVYSSFGGVKSVTFTDLIQFLTFGIVSPIVAFIIWQSLNSRGISLAHIMQDPLFDYTKVLDYRDANFINSLFLFLFFMIPGLDPAIFQRITMAKNTLQVSRSFIIAGIFIFICDQVINTFIGFLLKASNSVSLDATNVVGYILDTYLYAGFKGVFTIGIISMIMSSADSYINSSAILFTHDFCKSIKIQLNEKKELILVRCSALFIGIFALLISLFSKNLLELVLSAYGFYMPIVSVPLILAIFGFRSSSKAVLIGMSAGFIVVIICNTFFNIDGIIFGMIFNAIFFIGSHYLLRQKGGWIGIKEGSSLEFIKFEYKRRMNNFIEDIKNFSLLQFCKNNSPLEEKIYLYFGLFGLVAVFFNVCFLSNDVYKNHTILLQAFYFIMLTMATILIIYPLIAEKFQNKTIVPVIWNIIIMFFIFGNSFITILSNLNQMQFSVLIATTIIISLLFRWQVTIIIITIGLILSLQFYKIYIKAHFIENLFNSSQIQFMYSLILISSVLIVFVKPIQQKTENLENINNYLNQQNSKMQLDIVKLFRHREEFINRLNKQCIEAFISTFKQINLIENRLNTTSINNNKTELVRIIDKLKAGANYLNEIIDKVKYEVKINPIKVNLEKFIYKILNDYKKTNKIPELQILIFNKSQIKELYLDQEAIKKVFLTCIDYGLINSSNYKCIIMTEDTKIEYSINPNDPLKIKRKAIKFSILFDINKQKTTFIANKEFKLRDEINFNENCKIIEAHYGKIQIIINEQNQLNFFITIPAKLKEIRPKKTDNQDLEIEKVQLINEFIDNKVKESIYNIAKQLIKSNMDVSLIAKITKLSEQEINSLEMSV